MGERKLASVDFHIHYNDNSALEIIETAKEKNLVAIALVGRAQISDKLGEYIRYGEKIGIEVISGVEYVAEVDDNVFADLIALDFDYNHPSIQDYFGENEDRQKRINASVARGQFHFLLGEGFQFTELGYQNEELLNALLGGTITEKAIRFCQIAVANPVNRDLIEKLKEENQALSEDVFQSKKDKIYYQDTKNSEAKFLWSLYFLPSKRGFIPILSSASDIIQAVHRAQGVVLYSPEGKFSDEVWVKLQQLSIDGIMGWHAGRLELSMDLLRNIRNEGLLVLGGSDYNPDRNEWKIGSGKGPMFISPGRYADLLRYKRSKYNLGK